MPALDKRSGSFRLQNRVPRFNSGRGLQALSKTYAGLPDHVDPNDWELMTLSATSPELALLDDVAEDIEDHGFSYFKLVPPDTA